jgi:hypothetical protein
MGFVFDIIFEFFATMFGMERRDRRALKHQAAGQVDCGLRVMGGSQGGLKNGWRVRRATVHSGNLIFGQRRPIFVQVRAVSTDRQHRMGWRESRLIFDESWQIVEVITDSATLEWAVPEDKLEWAVARLRGSDPSAKPIGESPETPSLD